jgi:serine protease AprX
MRKNRFIQFLLVSALVLSAFGFAAPQQAAITKAQPLLAELAAQDPSQMVGVIVQKAAGEADAEAQVASLDGQVTADLSIINAFGAEMTAGAALELSRSENVRWVSLDTAMASTAAGDPTVRDEFATASYSNNNGTQSWSGAWIEVDGDGAGPTAGNVFITGGELSLDDYPDTSGQPSLAREADLSGALLATLSFKFQTTGGVDTSDSAVVEISADGGANYTILEEFAGIQGAAAGNRVYDITAFASHNTRVRFRIKELYGGYYEAFRVDNVQIEYALQATASTPTDPPAPMPSTSTGPITFTTWVSEPGPPASKPLVEDFEKNLIAKGNTIWFNSNMKAGGLDSKPVTIHFFDGQIRFIVDGGLPYEITLPEARVLFSPTAKSASTSYDAQTGTWLTIVPSSDYDHEAFLSGLAFPLEKSLPGDIKDVTITGRFTTDTPGVKVEWRWGAAVYTQFSTDYNALGVKPINDEKYNPYANKDKAGTPENFKSKLIAGASGDGKDKYTGDLSGGTEGIYDFVAASEMISHLGPDGVFAYGGKVRQSFTGLDVEVTPGHAITRVEAVLYAYTPAKLDHDFKLKLIAGDQSKDISIKSEWFDGNIGAANAGPVVVDITSARDWQWIDFYNGLELALDQYPLDEDEMVYYDAIGLRVTSAPGTDNSLDGLMDTTVPDKFINPYQQFNVYNHVINASELWNSYSKLQGKGIGVAVVDSGVAKVKDLKIKKSVNFNDSYHDSADRYGHGTFVAGIVAGNGESSDGRYIGVAPGASIYNVRVSDDNGMTYVSDVIEALQWIYENKDKTKIRVVNLSFNQSEPESYHTSPLNAAVEILWFNGIVVVVSAGNNGTATLYPPANDPFVITVGATDDRDTLTTNDDLVATFSAYGITADGFAKPDLVAPGRNIVGLLPMNDELNMGKEHRHSYVGTTYFRMSGTSVSAPMVSGAVALLLQDEPELNPDQVKARLMATADKNWPGYNPTTAGAGYLDIYAAVYANTTESANQGVTPSFMLSTGEDAIAFDSVGWNSVGWNSVGWNSVGWNSVGWNSVGWNSVGWNSVGWNSVGWNSDHWD